MEEQQEDLQIQREGDQTEQFPETDISAEHNTSAAQLEPQLRPSAELTSEALAAHNGENQQLNIANGVHDDTLDATRNSNSFDIDAAADDKDGVADQSAVDSFPHTTVVADETARAAVA